jgi:hypothetical protein
MVWFTFGTERRADDEGDTVHLRSGLSANNSLDRSGGSVFRNIKDAAKVA